MNHSIRIVDPKAAQALPPRRAPLAKACLQAFEKHPLLGLILALPLLGICGVAAVGGFALALAGPLIILLGFL